ncbi:ABC transporter substrate-binding protein [Streptomyces sp. NPDC047028]|uniref:ABC transporter substrate-binding protein n=1 Tax=Streptomyces sp. NPDC047028 TaxID=3155793 RepID=UPI0033E65219
MAPPPPRQDTDPTRRRVLAGGGAVAVAALAGPALTACGSQDDGSSGGKVRISMWHGQTDTGLAAVKDLVAKFEKEHPTISVDLGGGVLADAMLQKVTAGLASGSVPDIAYIFGSDLASLARSPRLADQTHLVGTGRTPWKNYWPAARDAVTVKGKVRATPALLDSLAVVCNKKVFRDARVPLPKAGWTWDDFVDTARALTDPKRNVFGTGWPGAGDEDTVWRIWPMIWDLGGDVIAPDGRRAGFSGEPGLRALGTIQSLVKDKSCYVDPKPGSEQMYQVFAGGRLGMVATGPWQLPDIRQAGIDYQVVPLPSYTGKPVTISGPDTWAVFDNGAARLKAARTLVSWLMQPAQDVIWDVQAGSLPLSRSAEDLAPWRKHAAELPGLPVFTSALATARVRPVNPAYPRVSKAVGTAITAVLLERSSPKAALRACLAEADSALAATKD